MKKILSLMIAALIVSSTTFTRYIDLSKEVKKSDSAQTVLDKLCQGKCVILKFSATWCGPCKRMAPTIKELAQEFDGEVDVVAIDTDTFPGLTRKYEIRGIPALVFVKDCKKIAHTNEWKGEKWQGKSEIRKRIVTVFGL